MVTDGYAKTTPNTCWRTVILTSDGTTTSCTIDGTKVNRTLAMGLAASLTGNWRVGKSYDGATPAKFTLRWMGFYNRQLTTSETTSLRKFLRAKKRNENPNITLWIEGGQSNHQVSHAVTSTMRSAAYNSVCAVDGGSGGTYFGFWWRFVNWNPANAQELTPYYSGTGATNGSVAREATYPVNKFHGPDNIAAWDAMLADFSDNPRDATFIVWIQGENDAADSRYMWFANNNSDWTAAPTDPYYNADNYGTLATGWNSYLRSRYNASSAYLLYHFVSFEKTYQAGLDTISKEAIARRNWNVRQAMITDARWFANDITDFPREPDNIHLNSPATTGTTPDSGSECLGRAQIRIANAAAKLSTLGYQARMLAMRAIDVGFELTNAQMDACTTFVAATGYSDIYSLVIPVLPATNTTFDRPRARRCNLMVHSKDKNNSAFSATAPANTTVLCGVGANTSAISTAVTALLAAWGLSDTVTVTADSPPFSMATYSPILSLDASIAASKLDASDATAADGAAVKTWVDQSGNNRNFSQGTSGYRPVNRVADGSLRFDGVDDFLSGTFPNMGNQFSVVFVGTRLSGGSYRNVFAFDTSMLCAWYGGSSFTMMNNSYQEFTIAAPGTKKVHVARFDPSTGGFWVNGTRYFTGGTGSVTRTTPTGQLGRRADGLFANMDINEIHVINRALSDAEVAAITTGLMAKNGL